MILAQSPANTGLSRGAITGIVVGSVLGGIVVIAVGTLAIMNSGHFTLPTDRAAGYRI